MSQVAVGVSAVAELEVVVVVVVVVVFVAFESMAQTRSQPDLVARKECAAAVAKTVAAANNVVE